MGVCCSGSTKGQITKIKAIDEDQKSLVWPSIGPLSNEELKKMALFPTREQSREYQESKVSLAKLDGSEPIFNVEELYDWPEDNTQELLETKYQEGIINKLKFSQSLLNLADHKEDFLWAQLKVYSGWLDRNGKYKDTRIYFGDFDPTSQFLKVRRKFEEHSGQKYDYKYPTIEKICLELDGEYEEEWVDGNEFLKRFPFGE